MVIKNLNIKEICPICKKENNCFSLNGKDPKLCWCMTISVPEELLDRIPSKQRGKACICKSCIEKFKREN